MGASEPQAMLMFLCVHVRRTGCYEVNMCTCHITERSLILGWDSYMNANRHNDSTLLQRKKGRVDT